ncbi:MAG: hypothetical protein IJ154_05645 [Bacteroidales bacterium]|nr:hypothetical protein [Bacteroidales bacterium]
MEIAFFFAWDFAAICMIAAMYQFLPETIVGEKHEYVSFTLWYLALFSVLMVISKNCIDSAIVKDSAPDAFFIGAAVCHYLYPFKKIKRHKTVSFLLTSIALYFILIHGAIILLYALGGGMY